MLGNLPTYFKFSRLVVKKNRNYYDHRRTRIFNLVIPIKNIIVISPKDLWNYCDFGIFLILLLFDTPGIAQLINWNSAPRKGFVFKISNKEAQKLLTRSTPDTIFNGLLHTQIDTFDVRKGWVNRPSKGHFILATINENKLHCEYTSVFPYQVFLLKEYDALSLQVVDFDGNVREDAKVKLKVRRLRIDPESKTYRIENAWFNDQNKIVTVELDGFRSVFNIEKHDVPMKTKMMTL